MAFGFDPRLILAGNQHTGPDPHETLRTMAQLAGAQQQRQIGQATLADLARKQQRQAQYEGLVQQNAGAPPAELVQMLQRGGFIDQAQDVEKHAAEVAKMRAQYDASLAEMDEKKAKREREQDTELANILYGAKPEDWEQRKASAIERGIPKAKVERIGEFAPGKADVLRNMVVSPEKQEAMAETKRHHEEMEKRPPGSAPILFVGDSGPQLVDKNTGRAKPVVDAQGNQVKPKPAAVKPLPSTERTELQKLNEAYLSVSGISGGFKDSYAGQGFAGETIQSLMSKAKSSGSKEMQAATAFWAKYQRLLELPERNAIFGASLTESELASWDKAKTIQPGTDPKIIRETFAELTAIAERKRANRSDSLKADGFSVEAIDAMIRAPATQKKSAGAKRSAAEIRAELEALKGAK